MRKILLLFLMASLGCVCRAVIVPVGYSNGEVSSSASEYILNSKGHVSAAVYVTPDLLSTYAGNQLVGVRAGVYTNKYCDSLRVWVRKSLDGENLATGVVRRAGDGVKPVTGWNEIKFDTPYDFNDGEGFYIGYTYSQKYGDKPISIVGEPRPNTSFIQLGKDKEWRDVSADGVLIIECLIDGENMPPCDLKVLSADAMLEGTGILSVTTKIANFGSATATEYDLSFTADGYNNVVTSKTPIASGKTVDVITLLENVPDGVGMDKPLTVTVTRIAEGDDVNPSDNSVVATSKVARNVVVEEFTGTGCGWCPRGLVGMKKMRDRYGSRFVGIGLHQYNSSDPMYISDYENLPWEGAPECMVNRGALTDPYYGTDNVDICHDLDREIAKGANVTVTVEGDYNEDKTTVNATVKVQAYANLSGLKLSLVLIADSLQGTTNSWKQSNYYYQYTASQLPDDLAQFGSGGERGQSSFFWPFDDVALSSYKENGKYYSEMGNFLNGESKELSYTVNMTSKQAVLSVLDYNKVAIIAMVLDNTGKVLNANKYYLSGTETGVRNVNTDTGMNVHEVFRYTIDGRMIRTGQPGVNIIRMSDGSTRKVLVK